jgi:hypothetical protein
MGKLDNLGVVNIDDGDKTGACGQDGLFCIGRSPIWVKCGGSRYVKSNCKNLCEFLDAKGANGHGEALKET